MFWLIAMALHGLWLLSKIIILCMKPTTHDLIYMAGLFDGEGSVGIYQHGKPTARRKVAQFMLIVQLSGTHEPMMQWVHRTFGGNIRREHDKPTTNPKWSMAWRWKTNSQHAGLFLSSIYPYLKAKRSQVRVALTFQAHVETYNYRRYRKQHSGGMKPLPQHVLNYRERLRLRLLAARNSERQKYQSAPTGL
jgi:hypothetical protein